MVSSACGLPWASSRLAEHAWKSYRMIDPARYSSTTSWQKKFHPSWLPLPTTCLGASGSRFNRLEAIIAWGFALESLTLIASLDQGPLPAAAATSHRPLGPVHLSPGQLASLRRLQASFGVPNLQNTSRLLTDIGSHLPFVELSQPDGPNVASPLTRY